MVVFVARDLEERPLDLQRKAVRCGLEMLRSLPDCNRRLAERGSAPLQVRVGLAAGPLVLGNMGSEVKLEYTVIGDVVNLAARLEGQATPGHLLMEEGLLEAVKGTVEVVAQRRIQVKGRSEPVDVIELRP
jgi:adenylate cyclase